MNKTLAAPDLETYLQDSSVSKSVSGISVAHSLVYSQSMLANAYFFGHDLWGCQYFQRETHNSDWKNRWQQVIPSWNGATVVDIGCGPGNVYATLGGHPQQIIGVDIGLSALKMAQEVGYTPLLADAQQLPLRSGFADIVTLNATVHHCDDMDRVLQEAGRLVRPGGLLVSDMDPQKTAWDFQGLGQRLDRARLNFPMHWPMRRMSYRSRAEIRVRQATEVHNDSPGSGVTPDLYWRTLGPLGFEVALYPHNHHIGAAVFDGDWGRAPWQHQIIQRLSGIDPTTSAAAQSVMCVARRRS